MLSLAKDNYRRELYACQKCFRTFIDLPIDLHIDFYYLDIGLFLYVLLYSK